MCYNLSKLAVIIHHFKIHNTSYYIVEHRLMNQNTDNANMRWNEMSRRSRDE